MSEIKGNIFIKGKNPRETSISLYGYADDLYQVLDNLGIIERMKKVPQLGALKVKKSYSKSRYDYFFLQVYLHKIIQEKLRKYLKYSYTNNVGADEFYEFDYMGLTDKRKLVKKQSFSSLIQMLVLLCNVGFFYNTFPASFAAIKISKTNDSFRSFIEKELNDTRYKDIFHKMINNEDYFHFNLLNSLIILQHCDHNSPAVICAFNLLYSYLNKEKLSDDSKLRVLFDVFRSVRGIAYMAYDLHIANIPLSFDLDDESSLCEFLKEYLNQYNDNTAIKQWSESVTKLLNDVLYCENSVAIGQYQLVTRIIKAVEDMPTYDYSDYYRDCFIADTSVFNRIIKYINVSKAYSKDVLKLTFKYDDNEKEPYDRLVEKLTHTNSVIIGCYHRHDNTRTILIKIKKDCKNKKEVALRVLRIVISCLQSIKGIKSHDTRYLLAVKFFLFHLLGENDISIEATIDEYKCVLCERGKKRRVKIIKNLLHNNESGSDTQKHEIEHLISCLQADEINDTAIAIVGSIKVKDQTDNRNKDLHEFDGMIVFPMRKNRQVLFLEAKTSRKSGRAQKCLKDKLNSFDISYDESNAIRRKGDTSLYVTI